MPAFHELPTSSEPPQDDTFVYSGSIYYHPASDSYIPTFLNIYDNEEVNNWLPSMVNAAVYSILRELTESGLSTHNYYAYRPFADISQTHDKIYMKYKGEVEIISDSFMKIPSSKIINKQAPITFPQEDQHAPGDPFAAAEEEISFIQSTLLNMLLPSPPSVVLALLQPPPVLLQPPPLFSLFADESHMNESHMNESHMDKSHKVSIVAKPQKRIADIMIADAVSKGLSCSISMNPLTPSTAVCVSPCYHIFEKESIQTWLAEKNTCPECREVCSL